MIPVDLPCGCAFHPYGHFHGYRDVKISRQRFNLAGPPVTAEEIERICEDAP